MDDGIDVIRVDILDVVDEEFCDFDGGVFSLTQVSADFDGALEHSGIQKDGMAASDLRRVHEEHVTNKRCDPEPSVKHDSRDKNRKKDFVFDSLALNVFERAPLEKEFEEVFGVAKKRGEIYKVELLLEKVKCCEHACES